MRRVKLGQICEVVSGGTPKTNVEEYWNGEFNWITPAEINDNDYIISDTKRKITQLAIEKKKLPLLPKGTVLLSSRAPIGKVAITGKEMYCNQGFKNLICSDEICNEYLYCYLKSKKEYLNSLGRGATFKEISKKIVEIPMGAEGRLADTIRMTLREDEILAMSSAIVEAAGINGAKLYATKYKEAGIQDAAVPTYRPNDSVTALITDSNGNVSNPNIVSSAVEELKKRYTTSATNARRYLEQQIGADYDTNVKNSMEESISNAQDARQKYLDSLGE